MNNMGTQVHEEGRRECMLFSCVCVVGVGEAALPVRAASCASHFIGPLRSHDGIQLSCMNNSFAMGTSMRQPHSHSRRQPVKYHSRILRSYCPASMPPGSHMIVYDAQPSFNELSECHPRILVSRIPASYRLGLQCARLQARADV